MQTILKYGFISGILMLVKGLLQITPVLEIYFDETISGVLRVTILGGSMLYAINHYLKNYNDDDSYRYWLGLVICMGTGILGMSVYSLVLVALMYKTMSILYAINSILQSLPLIIFLSLLIPLAYLSKTKKHTERDDILDSDI